MWISTVVGLVYRVQILSRKQKVASILHVPRWASAHSQVELCRLLLST